MRTVESYYYDSSKFRELLDEKFPTSVFSDVSIDTYSEEKVNELVGVLQDTLLKPKIKTMVLPDRIREDITCLPDKVKDKITSLFDDEDLLLFGHGGNAEEILKTGKMYCHYSNISSHFLALSQTNESLDNFNHWPHRDAHQILIMGINQKEFNPIFRKEDNKYSIPSEYFIGYYDRDLEDFIPNPDFKNRHEYVDEDPSLELHIGEYKPLIVSAELEDFEQILGDFQSINVLLSATAYLPLDKKGITDVSKQALHFVKNIYQKTKKITPDVIKKYKENNTLDSSNNSDDSWEFDFADDKELTAMINTDKPTNTNKNIRLS